MKAPIVLKQSIHSMTSYKFQAFTEIRTLVKPKTLTAGSGPLVMVTASQAISSCCFLMMVANKTDEKDMLMHTEK